MAKSLKDYIAEYKQKYEFIIKSTLDLSEYKEGIDKFLEITDIYYQLDSKSDITRNKFRKDIDFSGEDIIETWQMTVVYNYCVTDFELQRLFNHYVKIPNDKFIIRKSKSAEIIDSDKRASSEENEKEELLNSEIKPLEDVNQEDLAGQKYTDNMIKALKSEEFKNLSTVEEVKVKKAKSKK